MLRSHPEKQNPNYKGRNTWELVERTCVNCNAQFMVKRAVLIYRKNGGRFCKNACTIQYQKKSNTQYWSGKRNMKGYIYLHLPDHPKANSDGYVAEHRIIIEKSVGRYLERSEVVHHINRIKNDNRLENLRLLDSNSAHRQTHHQDLLTTMKNYWTPEKRKAQAERVAALRKTKFWSSRKK